MKKSVIMMVVFALLSCKEENQNSQGENFSNNVNKVANTIIDDSEQLAFFNTPKQPIQPKFEQLPSGSVQPKGWILNMMKSDLEQGIVGALGELYPGIKSDDLYNTARRGGMEDIPEMGDLVLTGAEWEKSIMWWNAETIGNWWDGFIRHAFMTNHQEAIQQSHKIIENLLNSQDADGYIGIYKPNLRYQHEGSNGELWAQTTAFRTMLAYYEFTQDKRVLDAVEKAMKLTMKNYGESGKNPFYLKNAFGGVTHGLMLTDVCETLFRITKNQNYQDYATYLYKAFSTYSINRSFNDLRYPFLSERDSLFEGHGVHTYEHIRSMVNAYYNTGYPELAKAYDNMLAKLEPVILPSGAGHADEWLLKKEAEPTKTAAEYCAMLELRNSYGSLLEKTGDIAFADAAEKLTYNAMLGARNQDGTAITYSKFDNSYTIDGKHHKQGEVKDEPRYKYSPTHSEPAVCCVPNYGRNLPYFLHQMYMKSDAVIMILMYGPSELTTEINGVNVSIEQETNYPWNNQVTFRVQTSEPVELSLKFRKPQWSKRVEFAGSESQLENDFYAVTKTWNGEETFTVTFDNPLELNNVEDEVYVQQGPVVYAYAIPHTEKTIKTYEGTNFRDYHALPKNEDARNYEIIPGTVSESNGKVSGKLYDSTNNKELDVELVPFGKTILRKTTFQIKNN